MLERIKWWVVLSTDWKLQDVQAGLVVVISILSFIAVFASARFFWHMSAKKISKSSDVPISSLLSFTTLGEVLDVVILLKTKLFHSKYFTLTIQCLLVVAFSACAIFAGPISRYATRVGQKDMLKPNAGLLASRGFACELNNVIRWQNISKSLDKANFPHDQLLDYLPDTNSDWTYVADDWNSTYTAKCSITTETNLTLEALGKYTSSKFWIYDNMPGLADVYSSKFLNDPNNTEYDYYYTGTKSYRNAVWRDMFFQQYAEYRPDQDGDVKKWDGTPTQHMSIHMSIIAMHDAPMYLTGNSSKFDYAFSKGKVPRAWYSKVECDLTRTQPVDKVSRWESYIDNECTMAQNMDMFFSPQSEIRHDDNTTTLIVPTGNQLFRFFQTYMISKDTHFPHPANRLITLRVPTVELSTFFIGVMSLVALFIIVGLIHGAICYFCYSHLYKRVPETKVDWLLQSLREAQVGSAAPPQQQQQTQRFLGSGPPSTISAEDEKFIPSEKSKMPWEKAYYSLQNPHQSPTPSETGFGRVSVGTRTPSPTPDSLVPGPSPSPSPRPPSFVSFLSSTNNHHNNNRGYSALPNPTPYIAPYPARSASPSFNTSPAMSPTLGPADRIVSYGMNTAKMQTMVTVGPKSERDEWEVGVLERR